MSQITDFNTIPVADADPTPVVVSRPVVVHPNGAGSEPQLIRQFNNTWTYVKRLVRDGDTVGWEFRCECSHHRKFTYAHFNDPYGAAVRARDTHLCVLVAVR